MRSLFSKALQRHNLKGPCKSLPFIYNFQHCYTVLFVCCTRTLYSKLILIKIFKIKHKTNRKAGLTCLNKDKEFCICRSYQFVSQLKSRHQLKLFKSYATLGTFKCSTFSCKNRTECVQLSIYMWLMVNSGNNYQKLNKAFCNEDMKTDKPKS